MQVYPGPAMPAKLSKLQQRLAKKLGEQSWAFSVPVPPGMPSSVTLQSPHSKRIGVEWELVVYVAGEPAERPHKRFKKKKKKN